MISEILFVVSLNQMKSGEAYKNYRRKNNYENCGYSILLIILGIIVGSVCLLLPSMTNNRVSFDEAALGLIPAVLLFLLGFLIVLVAGIFYIKGRKKVSP